MNESDFLKIAGRLMRLPVAPYFEQAVRSEVEAICRENQLEFKLDAAGNVIVRINRNRAVRPLVLAAHMDHPGFEVVRRLDPTRFHVRFNGGVPNEYFKEGMRLLLQPGDVPARLGKSLGKVKEYEAVIKEKDVAKSTSSSFGVWYLEPFVPGKGRIYGRGCDDLVGVAVILATMIELRKKPVHVIGVISRAEEVGFQGALLVAQSSVLPKNSLVISLETSKEMPPIVMGEGVIIRVGDKTSVFDSDATRFVTDVATSLKAADADFKFQRALMSGGTCEATAYQEYGFQTTAVCVALGNYHNCGPRQQIEQEFVSVEDAMGMVRLLNEVAREMGGLEARLKQLPKMLEKLSGKARKRLLVRRA